MSSSRCNLLLKSQLGSSRTCLALVLIKTLKRLRCEGGVPRVKAAQHKCEDRLSERESRRV